jgi:hypothetical protein
MRHNDQNTITRHTWCSRGIGTLATLLFAVSMPYLDQQDALIVVQNHPSARQYVVEQRV